VGDSPAAGEWQGEHWRETRGRLNSYPSSGAAVNKDFDDNNTPSGFVCLAASLGIEVYGLNPKMG
jgi:hypothetical protein